MAALLLGRLLLAAVFAAAAVAKLADVQGSRQAVAGFGVPERVARWLGVALPLSELAVAIGLLGAGPRSGALGALCLLLLFAAAMAWNLARGRAPDCHCFGQVHSAPASWRAVGRNLALAAIALGVAVLGAGGDLAAGTSAAAGAGILLVAVGLQIREVREARTSAPELTKGLPIGSQAPDFSLPDLSGSTVTLRSLLAGGRPLLLVFADRHCGPCEELAPDVARWQRERSDKLSIAVIERGHGDAGARADRHGRQSVLLAHDDDVAAAYLAEGTPAALMLAPNGRIASHVAPGAPAIEQLIADAVNPALAHRGRGPALGGSLGRREFVVRLASAWMGVGAALAWPVRAAVAAAPCPSVPPRQRRCGTKCVVEPLTNRSNCGCRGPCPSGHACAGGRCIHGDGSQCIVALRDAGADRSALLPPTQACQTPQHICCSRTCVDPRTNKRNCGGCGRTCTSGKRPACCFGVCTDLASDPRFCGSCFRRCPADKPICFAGQCRSQCPAGTRRCGNTCGHPRLEGCCGGRVLSRDDMQFDRNNCGGCGRRCGGTPTRPWICCGGRCVDITYDSDNCGRCFHKCGPDCMCILGRCVQRGVKHVQCP